jgi:hypothetical protein
MTQTTFVVRTPARRRWLSFAPNPELFAKRASSKRSDTRTFPRECGITWMMTNREKWAKRGRKWRHFSNFSLTIASAARSRLKPSLPARISAIELAKGGASGQFRVRTPLDCRTRSRIARLSRSLYFATLHYPPKPLGYELGSSFLCALQPSSLSGPIFWFNH